MSECCSDRIYEAVRTGRRLDFAPVIDVHGHFGPCPATNGRLLRDPARVRREMDAYGVDIVVFATIGVGYAGSLERANDEVLRLVNTLPGRALGYCTLSSVRPERNLAELERCYELGLRCGVKMHRYVQPAYRITDAVLEPVFEFLDAHGLIYINHELGTVAEVTEIAQRYPNVTLCNGHGGIQHAELGLKLPNVYANSCSMMWCRTVEDLVETCGSGHLLLGSDFSLFQLGWGVGPVAYAETSEQAKLDILGGNAMKVLARMAWFEDDPPAGLEPYP